MDERLKAAALDDHRLPRPGKIAVVSTKELANQQDLALAYAPLWQRRARRLSPIWPSRPQGSFISQKILFSY